LVEVPVVNTNVKEIGYAALALAIIEGYTPEGALQVVETGEEPTTKFNGTNDVLDMIILKYTDDMTYKEVGRVYNLSADNVYNKVRRLAAKKRTEDIVKLYDAGLDFNQVAKVFRMSRQGICYRYNKVRGGDNEES
jgi:Mor family transcriptional regulator